MSRTCTYQLRSPSRRALRKVSKRSYIHLHHGIYLPKRVLIDLCEDPIEKIFVAAYQLLANLAGNPSASEEDVCKILESVGANVEEGNKLPTAMIPRPVPTID